MYFSSAPRRAVSYLEDVSDCRLVVDGFTEYAVLIAADGREDVENGGIHRTEAVCHEADGDALPAWPALLGPAAPEFRATCLSGHARKRTYALVLHISRMLSIKLCSVRAYKILSSLSAGQWVRVQRQRTARDGDQQLSLTSVLVHTEVPTVLDCEIIRIARRGRVAHMAVGQSAAHK